jgi:hypothetical protein
LSHIVEIQTQVRDAVAVHNACVRLKIAMPSFQTVRLFSGRETGFVVQLPDWKYPIVCDLKSGQLKYDNFQGFWGDSKELDRFLQAYAVEKTRIEVRKKGHSVTEQQLADGTIKLTIQIAGGAT